MRALVYHGPGRKAWEEVPRPTIVDDTDAIVRVDAVTICGTDLHILKGDVPAVTDGRILGHEAVGTVESVGAGVKTVKRRRPGARLVHHRVRHVPLLPGRQLRPVPRRRWLDPRSQDRRHPGGVRAGAVRRHVHLPGPRRCRRRADADARRHPARPATRSASSTVMCNPATWSRSSAPGPIGLSAIMGARLFSPSHVVAIDLADSRLEAAKQFGADIMVNNGRRTRSRSSRDLTDGLGADVAIEAVGVPADVRAARASWPDPAVTSPTSACTANRPPCTSRSCGSGTSRSRPGSSTRTRRRRCSGSRTGHQLDAGRFVTHHFGLDQFDEAYDVFGERGRDRRAQGRAHPELTVHDAGAVSVVASPFVADARHAVRARSAQWDARRSS